MLVVEIVGPAGAGKTTLLRTLSQRNHKIRAVSSLRSASYIPHFMGQAVLLLPTLLRQYPNLKGFTWRELRMTVRLRVMQQDLKRQARNHWTVTLLDQGPVFTLTRLHRFYFKSIKDPSLETWWHCVLRQWAPTLDLVIWLDAPDAVLAERIHARDKWHTVKGETGEEARQYLTYYRKSYEQVIEKLCNHGPLTILRFDTAQESLHQITSKVLAVLNLGSGRRA